MLAKEISDSGNERDPHCRAQKIEKGKSAPPHSQYPSHGSGKNAHAEDKASKENGGCSVASEQFLAALQGARPNPEDALIAIKQWSPTIMADSVADFAT